MAEHPKPWRSSSQLWDHRFLIMAREVAAWSKDPSTKVGTVLVDPKRRIIGTGYNGFARGVCDSQERYDVREVKYEMTVHAEVNAVLNAVADTEGATCYSLQQPCARCTGVLIQAGITRIVCPKPEGGYAERFAQSLELANQMLIETHMNCNYHYMVPAVKYQVV